MRVSCKEFSVDAGRIHKTSGLFRRIVSGSMAGIFLFTSVLSPATGWAREAGPALPLPQPGAILSVSEKFAPAIMRGLTVYPENPLQFDFIIDTGDKDLDGPAFEEESRRLIKYFLAALTVPEKELWVNLSPYEGHRIIPEGLGVTEMGRDMLAQDYLLKQLTASLIYPEKEMGQAFWQKIYRKAYELYGTTNIPVNTFNKVWIVPDKAVVYEHDGSAFVVERHLKVMLEKDYLALRNNLGNEKFGMKDQPRDQAQELNDVSSQIVREILLPAIEQEVNEGETFANLRQIYNSMILATWYKKNLRSGLLGRVYMDQNKVKGIDLEDKAVKERIYAQYLETFKKGVYNYIREDYDETTRRKVPRKYFSGGLGVGVVTEDKLEVLRGGLRALPESVSSAITRPESSRGEDRRVTIELVENAVEDGGLSPVIDSLEFSSPIQEQEGQPRLKSRRQFLKEIFLIAGGLALTGSLPGAAAALTGGQEQVVSQVPRGSELEVLLKQLNPDNYEEQVQRLLDERRSLDWSEITAKQIIDGRIKEIYAKRVDAAKRLLELEDRRTVPGFIEAYRTGRLLFYKRSNSLDEYLEDLLVYSSKAFAMFGSKEAVPALLEGMGAGGLKIETLQITMNTLLLLEAEKEAVGVLFDVYYQTLSYPTYEHFFENVIDIRNAEIIPLLLEKLSEPSFSYMSVYQVLERMRVALRWLSRMGKDAEDAAPVIAEFLNRFKFRKSDVRLDILETLSVLGPYAYKAVPVLIKCLSNSNGYFAGKVAETLGAIGDLRAIPALVETLHYEGTAARSGALKALKAFPQNAHPVLQWDDTKDFPDLESLVSIYLKETASMKRIIALFLAAPFFKDRAVVFLKKKIAAENDQTLKEEYISLVTAIRYQTIERWIDNNKVETIIAGGAAGVLVIGGVKVTFGAWRKYTLRGNLYDLVHGNDKRSTYDIISNIISYKSRAVSRIISNFLEDDELKENDAFRYPEARLLDFLEHGVTADVIQKFSLLEKEHFSKLPDYLQRRLLDRAIENKQKEDLLSLKKYYASQPDTLYEVDEALVKLEGDYEDVLNFYIKNLENISIYNRERAVLRLGEIGDLRAVPIIEKYLSIVEAGQLVEERGYWDSLNEALVKLKGTKEEQIKFYLESLVERGDRAKRRAIRMLAEWRVEEVIPFLWELFADYSSNSFLIDESITALVKLGYFEQAKQKLRDIIDPLEREIDAEPDFLFVSEEVDPSIGQGPENQLWGQGIYTRTTEIPNEHKTDLISKKSPYQKRLDLLLSVNQTYNQENVSSPVSWDQDLTENYTVKQSQGLLRYSLADMRSRKTGRFTLFYGEGLAGSMNPHSEENNLPVNVVRPFDPEQFNFNKDFVAPQQLFPMTLAGYPARVNININPEGPYHFVLLPEPEANLPQVIEARHIEMTLALLKLSQSQNLKLGHNSLGAAGGVNHLHIHGIYNEENVLSIETAAWVELLNIQGVSISALQDYPARGLVFSGEDDHSVSEAAGDFIALLRQRNIAYTVLMTQNGVFVLPRQHVAGQVKEDFRYNLGFSPMAGRFYVHSKDLYDQMNEADIARAIADVTVPEGLFNDLVGKFLEGNFAQSSSSPLDTPGGIDFNPAALDLQIKRDGNGVALPLPQQPVGNMKIDGFLPVIINITPVNIPLLLGMTQKGPAEGAASTDSPQAPADIRERFYSGHASNIRWFN